MSKEDPVELEIPETVTDARQAVEVLRAFIADGALMLSLNAEAFGERVGDWGRLLGEIGQHIARSAALQGVATEHEALAEVRKGFDATIMQSTAAMTGAVRGRSTH